MMRMKNSRVLIPFFLMLIALFCQQTWAQTALIRDMEIISGPRGIAMVMHSDRVLNISNTGSIEQSGDILKMTFKNVEADLSKESYTGFPEAFPISKVRAYSKGRDLFVDIYTRGMSTGKIKTKASGKRILALLTKTPSMRFSWSASEEEGRGTGEGAGGSEGALEPVLLDSISTLVRGGFESASLMFSGAVECDVEREGRTIKIRAYNCTGDPGFTQISFPDHSGFNDLSITSGSIKDEPLLSLEILMKKGFPQNGLLVRNPGGNRVDLLLFHPDRLRIAEWSPASEEGYSKTFAHYEPGDFSYLDMVEQDTKEPETKSEHRETTGSEERGDNFTDSESPDQLEGPDQVILVKDNVNFRSEPDLSDDSNVIRRLVIGTEVVRTQRQGKWSRIKTDKGSTGWIYSTMVEPVESLSSEEYSELREHRKRIGSEDEGSEVSSKPIDSFSKIPVPEETAMSGFDMTEDVEAPEQEREDLPGSAKEKESEEYAGESPEEQMVPYRTFGRDPFIPLEDSVLIEKGLPDVQNFDLVGLVYNEGGENLAVLQHMNEEAENYVLKENDKVAKGRVLKIKEDRVVFLITDMGMSRTYTIEIQEDKE